MKRGPALRNRLEGAAATYKHFLDHAQLVSEEGVNYFLKTLRPFFVKNPNSTFLWRFMHIMRFHRGNQDMMQWLGKFLIIRKKTQDAWMELRTKVSSETDPHFVVYATGRRVLAQNQAASSYENHSVAPE